MASITFVQTIAAPVHLDYLQDALSGLNVRPNNYMSDEVTVEVNSYYDDRFDTILVPFVVCVWDDGLDYDMDGNAYFDDYPGDQPVSFHASREGAEREAAWLEHRGTASRRISIMEDYLACRWDLEYKPLRD